MIRSDVTSSSSTSELQPHRKHVAAAPRRSAAATYHAAARPAPDAAAEAAAAAAHPNFNLTGSTSPPRHDARPPPPTTQPRDQHQMRRRRQQQQQRCAAALLAFLAATLLLEAAAGAGAGAGERSRQEHHRRRRPLRFASDGSFKVALFADLHYGENAWTDWGPRQDAASDRVMAAVLDAENPDFVVYLGDLLTANNMPIPNATSYWHRATSPARLRRIPWATVFGNHDDMPFEWPPEWFSPAGVPPLSCPPANDARCSFRGTPRVDLMAAETSSPLSYSSDGPEDLWPSVSNYVLEVLSRKKKKKQKQQQEEDDDPALLIYFLDSGGGSYPEIISSSQVNWFQSHSHFLNPDARIPELIFWHIPSTAYMEVAPKAGTEVRAPCVGSLNEEDVAPQAAEWGIMEALARRPSVKAVFVGHNHGLDWCCPGQGQLWLCFARHTGHGGYGGWPRGARVVEVAEGPPPTVASWIRMEDGTRHGEVLLTG